MKDAVRCLCELQVITLNALQAGVDKNGTLDYAEFVTVCSCEENRK